MKPAAPTIVRKAPARPLGKMPRLGWLEVVVLSQTILPAMMFVPALLRFRFVTRVAAFVLPATAWLIYAAMGRRTPGRPLYIPVAFLAFCGIWIGVSVFVNPGVNSLLSALCELGIAVGVLAPAFWAPDSIRDTRQLGRLMILLLVCNGASACMGLAQVYRPETFRPPKIDMFERNPDKEVAMEIELSDGRRVLRPPGLTDTPGGAAIGGQASCAIGLALALMPIPWWKRGIGLGMALIGLTILFYSQVRVLLVTLILGMLVWSVLLALRGEFRKLTTLAICAGVIGLVAVAWVMTSGGQKVMSRFLMLLEDDALTVYNKNRGAFVANALSEVLPTYPLGAGPGRAGMAQRMFGDPLAPVDRAPLYAETQIEMWILDGGAPLLLAYLMALIAAFLSASWTALKCPDPEVSYWAGVVIVYGVAVIASAFGYPAFTAPAGVQFWALFGALFGADYIARKRARKAAT